MNHITAYSIDRSTRTYLFIHRENGKCSIYMLDTKIRCDRLDRATKEHTIMPLSHAYAFLNGTSMTFAK